MRNVSENKQFLVSDILCTHGKK